MHIYLNCCVYIYISGTSVVLVVRFIFYAVFICIVFCGAVQCLWASSFKYVSSEFAVFQMAVATCTRSLKKISHCLVPVDEHSDYQHEPVGDSLLTQSDMFQGAVGPRAISLWITIH